MDWQRPIARILNWVDEKFDRLQYGSRGERVRRCKLAITPYLGFGASRFIYLKGRVLEDKRILPSKEGDTVWENLANMYRRFQSDEIPGARLLASYQSVQVETVTDSEGFFELHLNLPTSLPHEADWQDVSLELRPPRPPNGAFEQVLGRVQLIKPQAEYGVISDIDDTILISHSTNLLRMGLIMLLNNAYQRQTFSGVPLFYQALQQGRRGEPVNPLFYVSSTPWNLYDLLVEFLQIQGIPLGPMVSLRDWGITGQEFLPSKHRQHKLGAIRKILDLLPHLPFLLIGDSGQEDPEIYLDVVRDYPGRILGVYIRHLSRGRKRDEAIRRAGEKIKATGSAFLLTADTQEMARHAADQGLIGKK
jgi:phosphatidate phosphatase APP1